MITYDPNLRLPLWKSPAEAKEQLLWGLGQADVVKISEEEVRFLFGLGAKDGMEHICRNFPAKLVFVTCGADGCYFQNARAAGWEAALPGLQVVDTTGAGDAFNGGFATALSNGMELFDAVRYGNCTGALSVTKPGTAKAMPCKAEIDALYQARYGG